MVTLHLFDTRLLRDGIESPSILENSSFDFGGLLSTRLTNCKGGSPSIFLSLACPPDISPALNFAALKLSPALNFTMKNRGTACSLAFTRRNDYIVSVDGTGRCTRRPFAQSGKEALSVFYKKYGLYSLFALSLVRSIDHFVPKYMPVGVDQYMTYVIFRTLFTSSKFTGWVVCARLGVRAIYFAKIRNDIFFAFGNPNVKHDSSCLLSFISV